MMLYDIVKNNNYPTIECRMLIDLPNGNTIDTLFGYCSYVDDILQSLDGDCYTLSMIIDKYEYDKEKDVLYVWEKTKVLKGEEYDKYLEEQKNDNGKRM